MAERVPVVSYLDLDDPAGPRLVANQCDGCGARFFDARQACARCDGRDFSRVPLPTEGTIGTYTIVHRSPANVPTPYVAAVVYLSDSTAVRTNLVGIDPSPDAVGLGRPVRLTTVPAGIDDNGVEAVAYAFEPVEVGA